MAFRTYHKLLLHFNHTQGELEDSQECKNNTVTIAIMVDYLPGTETTNTMLQGSSDHLLSL